MAKKIMAWSQCSITIGETGALDAMALVLAPIGDIKNKSTILTPSDGETLKSELTGGILGAMEETEGGYSLTTRVVEPEDALYVTLGLGTITAEELGVNTHVVEGEYSLKVSPKNVGAKGIKAAKTHVTFKPGWSEEEGNFADVTFQILKPSTGVWYSHFKKAAV